MVDVLALVAHHVQHWTKNFPLQFVEAFQFDQRRHHEGAAFHFFSVGDGHLVHAAPFVAHALDVFLDTGLGFGVDHRANVHVQALRVTQAALGHGALEHLDHAVGRVFLQAQHAQCRAALTGAVESRGNDVDDDLFGECRGVDDHRVLAAGFGDQRDRAALGVQAAGEVALDDPGHLGGAGEHHAADALVGDQRGPHGLTAAG
ncbi:hypothetical protein D9M73_167690 [compost metagenome]